MHFSTSAPPKRWNWNANRKRKAAERRRRNSSVDRRVQRCIRNQPYILLRDCRHQAEVLHNTESVQSMRVDDDAGKNKSMDELDDKNEEATVKAKTGKPSSDDNSPNDGRVETQMKLKLVHWNEAEDEAEEGSRWFFHQEKAIQTQHGNQPRRFKGTRRVEVATKHGRRTKCG